MCQHWFEATSYSLCASQWLSCDGSQRLRCRSQTPHSCALRTMDGELGHTTTSTREGCMGQRRRGWGSECCDSHSHTLRCHLCDGEMLHHSLCAHCTAHHTRGVIVTHSLTQVGSRGSGQNIQQLCCLVRVSWFSFGLPQPSEEKCHVITTPEKKPCPDVTGCVTSS